MKIENTTPTEAQIELAGYLLTRETIFIEECEADIKAGKTVWYGVASTSLEDIMGLTPYRSGYKDIAEYEYQEDLIEAKEARKNWYCDQQDAWEEEQKKEEEAHQKALREYVKTEYQPLGVPVLV
jgi:hypothetical protein